MDEAGTVWCTAVLDLQPPPSISQIVALGFKSPALAGSTDVVIQGLNRDTEYDVYCFAQDDGTMSAQNSSLEVRLSKKNAIGYTEMVATKMDAHVIYDSTAPLLVSTTPVHNAAGVAELVNISLTFDEDIQERPERASDGSDIGCLILDGYGPDDSKPNPFGQL
eukprot:g20881.t1